MSIFEDKVAFSVNSKGSLDCICRSADAETKSTERLPSALEWMSGNLRSDSKGKRKFSISVKGHRLRPTEEPEVYSLMAVVDCDNDTDMAFVNVLRPQKEGN